MRGPPIFNKSIVVDALDLPREVDDWCIENDISTHYVESLVRIFKDEPSEPGPNPLLEWLKSAGVDIEEYSDGQQYFISIMGT